MIGLAFFAGFIGGVSTAALWFHHRETIALAKIEQTLEIIRNSKLEWKA